MTTVTNDALYQQTIERLIIKNIIQSSMQQSTQVPTIQLLVFHHKTDEQIKDRKYPNSFTFWPPQHQRLPLLPRDACGRGTQTGESTTPAVGGKQKPKKKKKKKNFNHIQPSGKTMNS
jgi:hypothetical protein